MKFIHLIVVGDETPDEHLGGVSVLGADRAILFNINKLRRREAEELRGKLGELNIPTRIMDTPGEDYRDIFWAGRSVFEVHAIEKDISYAINLSSGSRLALAALEDALRSPTTHFHADAPEHHLSKPTPPKPAFRYEVVLGEKKSVRVAPLTFPPIPPVTPRDEWVRYAGLREKLWIIRTRISYRLTIYTIRYKRKWNNFKRKLGLMS